MKKGLLAALSLWSALSACSTPYQAGGYLGGYTDTQLGDNIFSVTFSANGYTGPDQATDFLMLRAADLTLSHGYKYFTITDTQNSGTSSFIGSYGGGSIGGGELYAPRGTIRITCFKTRGDDNRDYLDAALISRNVRSKYDIK